MSTCRNCGIDDRNASGNCRPCSKASTEKWKKDNPERLKELKARSYQRNKDKVDATNKKWKIENPDKSKAITQKWKKNNKDKIKKYSLRYSKENKDKIKKISKEWLSKNMDKHCAYQNKRRALKLNATPKWLTKKQLYAMEDMYSLARDCYLTSGQHYDVDHIVPLKGKSVCGLHVPWNLQILPSDINRSKSNSFKE